jgi:diguanylate cyclase (GGDEF)-like protein
MASGVRTNLLAFKYIAIRTVAVSALAVTVMTITLLATYGTDLGVKYTLASGLRTGVALTLFQTTLFCVALASKDVMILRRLDRAHDELDRLARTDPLTGLLNRRGFDAMAAGLARTARGRPAAALMLDIDFFKTINDSHGHEAGDAALIQLAAILRETAGRSGALVCRQGGEEFTMLLPGHPVEEARAIAEAVRQACEARPLADGRESLRFTISIGLAASAAWDGDVGALAAKADAALYKAKRSGRNRVVVDGEMDQAKAA